ncbi:UvrD-helicase domain-containing protein [Methylotenera sp.]|uniref:UvrD-helicase domain-containing protein n=1 Tax=Methylotenera sp. TaxID=2051956 RepID=UPI00272FECEE|nr:UvrD-helicase domain-containing protein [Methylotenera sp.]MDP2072209.1 UvrD-helicase domain-containing protein [Methylotenera sp.]MDP3005581.1 UvrD-helicase domain-containing protein [Methylotenera sp.]
MTTPQALNLEADEKNRSRALELTSFIVEAPAGAGKTELLTQRYLKLLQTVNAPEEIIAITFTNKAAAEMRLRILDSLIRADNEDVPEQAHKQITYELSLKALQKSQENNWQLIENPARLRIFTIDSLCAHLARQMPLMSRFGSQPRVTDEASALYGQAAEQTLALLEDATHCDVVKDALRYVDNDANQLKNLLIAMLEKRDQWLHHAQHEVDAEQLQSTLRYLVEQELEAIASVFNSRIQYELMPLARFAASQLPCEHPIALLRDWESTLPTHADALPMWLAVRELVLTKDDKIRARVDKNTGFPAEYKDEKASFNAFLASLEAGGSFAESLAKTRTLPAVSTNQEGWQIITTLSRLLNLAVAELWLVFQRAGEVDFVEIAYRATRALSDNFGEPTELALKLDYQIQHLLVDEFQDTSPSQIKLLEQLTLGWQVGDSRTLFTVGDPMQSIYRFRKANVGLFIEAANHGIGDIKLEKLQLYRNNRSCPAVVDWINQTFAPIFPASDAVTQGAIQYRPFIATKPDAIQAGVEVHPIVSLVDESSALASQREADAVIKIIQRERAADPNKKIAVLVRAKKHLASLVTKLRRNHPEIAFQAVEIEALEGRQIVQDLLSLTHALHHRADRVHWLSILRAPWCGLTLHDLHALAGHNQHDSIWSLMQNDEVVKGLSADGKMRLHHVREIFAEAFETQGRMNVSRWVRGVWLMLNGTACLWEQSDVVDVQAFFACLDNLDRSNQFSPERMQTEITKLFAAPETQGESLQMMTIHKSKGLEFDTVILPGLGASIGGNHGDKPIVLWEEVLVNPHHDHAQYELLAAPFIPKGLRDKDKVSAYDYLESRESARDANEDARVLYVAATRAERQLHLVGIANKNAKGEVSPTKNTYLDLLWPAVATVYESAEPPQQQVDTEDTIANFTPRLVRLKQLQVPAVLQTKHSIAATSQNNFAAQPSLVQSLEADIGTLAHRYMEMIAQQGLAAWSAARIATLNPAMQHWLRQQGHAEKIAMEAGQRVQNLLEVTLQSEDGQWLLKARGEAELGITSMHNGEVKNYIVDRTFIENDVRWIVDYKTIALTADASNATLKIAAENYREQLKNYAILFADESKQVKCAVFFMAISKLVLLD